MHTQLPLSLRFVWSEEAFWDQRLAIPIPKLFSFWCDDDLHHHRCRDQERYDGRRRSTVHLGLLVGLRTVLWYDSLHLLPDRERSRVCAFA